MSTLTSLMPFPEITCPKIRGSVRVKSYDFCKRLMDIIIASFALILLAPVFLITALVVKLTDGGPALFRQTRVGKGGRHFACYKFRSMLMDAEKQQSKLTQLNQHNNQTTFKMKNDPRITWIGRIIRKTSIDELPQLWNVLIGNMTLVGPRPPLPVEVSRYSPSDMRRLSVTPGITCIWQVSGRANLPFDVQVRMDVEYIEQRSLWLDVKLLVLTVPAVLLGKGAY